MNKKNIIPNPQQPVDRVPTGQLPTLLAELEEASLSNTHTLPTVYVDDPIRREWYASNGVCSYDGEDE